MLKLVEDLQDSGHIIYTDSFYTSPNVVKEMQSQGMGHCGTVRSGRKNMPPELNSKTLKLRKGDEPVFMKSITTNIVAYAWQDVKFVTFLSSVHSDNTVDKRMKSGDHEGGYRQVEKPLIAVQRV